MGRPAVAFDKLKVIPTALRDGSHFLEWEHLRLNDGALVADVPLSSA